MVGGNITIIVSCDAVFDVVRGSALFVLSLPAAALALSSAGQGGNAGTWTSVCETMEESKKNDVDDDDNLTLFSSSDDVPRIPALDLSLILQSIAIQHATCSLIS